MATHRHKYNITVIPISLALCRALQDSTISLCRVLMFIKNSFQGVVPAMSLHHNDKKLIAAITRELKGYVACLEKQRCVYLMHGWCVLCVPK